MAIVLSRSLRPFPRPLVQSFGSLQQHEIKEPRRACSNRLEGSACSSLEQLPSSSRWKNGTDGIEVNPQGFKIDAQAEHQHASVRETDHECSPLQVIDIAPVEVESRMN